MAINGVSLGSNPYVQNAQSQSGLSAAFKQRKQDFSTLANALSSGDLQGAQQAFASLQQDMQAIQQARGAQGAGPDGNFNGNAQNGQGGAQGAASQRQQDFSALASALSSGDLQGAQKAFATLQQDMQALRQGHHHHGGGSAQPTAAETGNAGQTPTVSETSINITA